MRSGARLDFVAKSLALAGLGVLGFSAALFDRWTVVLPPVAAPAMGGMTPGVQIAMTLPESGTPTIQSASVTVPRERRPPAVPSPDHAAVNVTTATETVPGKPEAPAIVPHELPVPVQSAPWPGAVVALSPVPEVVDTWQPMAASLAPPADRADEEGFVSGVLKRTGSSVSTSLGKASNTVVGAVRVVGGVVKRAF